MLHPESPALNSHDTWDWPVVGATFCLNAKRIDSFNQINLSLWTVWWRAARGQELPECEEGKPGLMETSAWQRGISEVSSWQRGPGGPCICGRRTCREITENIHFLYDLVQVRLPHKGRVPMQHVYQNYLESLLKMQIPSKTLPSFQKIMIKIWCEV